MFKKSLVVLVVLLFAFAILTGCSSTEKTTGSEDETNVEANESSVEPITFSFAHALAEDSQFGLGARHFAEYVDEKSNGTIKIEVFDNSQLGNSREMVEGVQMGTIDFTLVGCASAGPFVPEIQILEGPFLFDSKEQAYNFLDGEYGQSMLDLFTPSKFKALAWWENGYRHLTTKGKVVNPEDLKGMKIRCQEIPLHVKTFEILGALATPMQWTEVYTGLQQGTIDGQENPLAQIYTGKIYEVTDYLAMTGHFYGPAVLLMSESTWDKMTPDQQAIIQEAAKEGAVWERNKIAEMETEWLAELEDKMEVTEANDIDKEKWKEAVQPVYDWYIEEYGGQEIIDAIKATK